MFSSEYLRKTRLDTFTDSSTFQGDLEALFKETVARIMVDVENHGGNFRLTGLPGLAVMVLSKSGRLFNYVIMDKPGKGDFGDEAEDLLRFAVYLVLYYKGLEAVRKV